MIKFISLIMENCESIDIAPEDIDILYINDIHTKIMKIQSYDPIKKINTANTVFIKLLSCANKQLPTELNKCTVFDRLLKYKDITAICITYNNSTQEYYYVDYKEDKKLNNINQQVLLTDTNSLFLLISSTEDISTFMIK